jgi:hypothetical protein
MKLIALLLASSLLASPAIAEQCTQAVPAVAPCEGVLLPRPWALSCVECKQVTVPLCEAQKDQLAAQLRMARFDLDRSRDEAVRGWYEHPVLWFAAGVVVTGAGALYLLR